MAGIMSGELLYKVLRTAEWHEAQTQRVITGSPDDVRDGFIHLSTRAQLAGTLARHFAGEAGLVVLEIAADRLSAGLRWEPSRDGALFPHLYGLLPLDAVIRTIAIPPPVGGRHDLPLGS
jgi:uncharacterized protein (DUF952 family)